MLPTIAAKLKGKIPILVDGCVATGTDVLKYVALGADVAMVGRYIVRAAFGGGPDGVALFMNKMKAEFASASQRPGDKPAGAGNDDQVVAIELALDSNFSVVVHIGIRLSDRLSHETWTFYKPLGLSRLSQP